MTLQEQFIAFKTIVIKEVYRFSRIWVQTIIPPVITISLYFIIFGKLIGSQIGDMNGFRYMDYIVPGLIMMAVITNSYANVVSSFYGAKFSRHSRRDAARTAGYHAERVIQFLHDESFGKSGDGRKRMVPAVSYPPRRSP